MAHEGAAARPGEGDEDGRRWGYRFSGLPWGYGTPAQDRAAHAAATEIAPERVHRAASACPVAYFVHAVRPEARLAHALASAASFTATIGV